MEDILEGGFFGADSADPYGASPDGRIIKGNRQELAEIKCPQVPMQIRTLIYGLDDDYMAQIQGQLLISQFDFCHFYSYRHDCPAYYTKVYPDPQWQADLARVLAEFCDGLNRHAAQAKAMDGWKIEP
jgi:hypothetical protein